MVIFCGHGDLQHGGGLNLGFVSEREGAPFDLVDHATMAGYLLAQPTLRLVLLNGCITEALAKELADRVLLQPGGSGSALAHIVCWRTVTRDEAAQPFGEHFVRQHLAGGGESAAQAYLSAKGAVSDARVGDVLGTGQGARVRQWAFENPVTADGSVWVAPGGAATQAAGIPLLVDLQASARMLAAAGDMAAAEREAQLHEAKARRLAARATGAAREVLDAQAVLGLERLFAEAARFVGQEQPRQPWADRLCGVYGEEEQAFADFGHRLRQLVAGAPDGVPASWEAEDAHDAARDGADRGRKLQAHQLQAGAGSASGSGSGIGADGSSGSGGAAV